MGNTRITCLFFLGLCFCAAPVVRAGTRVGTGGDPIDSFLNFGRQAILKTMRHMVEHQVEDRQKLERFCLERGGYGEKAGFCADFLLEIAPAILACHDNGREIPLIPEIPDHEDDYMVDYGEGLRPVSALTTPGCDTPIYFHYERVRSMWSRDLILLLIHEFGHKVPFQGEYLTDHRPIGPFDHEHELLNLAAQSLLIYGLSPGVGTISSLTVQPHIERDAFACLLTSSTTDEPIAFTVLNTRLRQGDGRFFSVTDYFHALGWPLNPYLPEAVRPTNAYYLKINVNGDENCAYSGDTDFTQLQIIHDTNGGEALTTGHQWPENAFCVDPPENLTIGLRISDRLSIDVTCRYDQRRRQ